MALFSFVRRQICVTVYKSVNARMVHHKCRNRVYPLSTVQRLQVSDLKVPWSIPWEDYNPPEYNADAIKDKPWADPFRSGSFQPKWNSLDGNVNRESFAGDYQVVDGYPLNPEGRTGLKGRGLLGRWGPNHAADPIVSRWKRINGEKQFDDMSKLPILEICVIQRRDSGEWAIPGGMVDPGEKVSIALKREFMEETLNSLECDPSEKSKNEQILNEFFAAGVEVYKGYVDDPRNTDNAWMETVAVNFHDEDNKTVGKLSLQAGDDARNVKWLEIHKDLNLYASHIKLLHEVVTLLQAHW